MSPPDNTLLMPEDKTFELLTERAKTSGDRWMVRIFRKKGITGLGESLATFANGTIEQLAQPEPWVSRLAGGGEYNIQVAHMDETQKRVGGFLKFKIGGENRPLNPYAVQGPDWEGPTVMTYPVPGGAPTPLPVPGQQSRPTWGWTDPAQQPTETFRTQQAPGVPADTLFLREQAAVDRHTARERELATREASLQKQLTEREEALKRAELEQRMRTETERARTEAAAHARGLEEKINLLLNAPKREDGMKLGEIIAALGVTLTPLITAMMQNSAASREASQRQQTEAANAHNLLIQQMLQKPNGLPPEVTMLFEMQKNQSVGNAEMMTRIVDAMGAVSKTSVSMIEAVADMNFGGQPENPMISMVREGVKAVSMLANGAKTGAKQQIQAQQAQLTPQQQLQQQQINQQVQAQRQQAQNQNQPGSHAQPVQPQPQNGAAGATAVGPQTPNGLTEPARNSVEELIRMIRNRYEPVEKVAQYFIEATKTPEMKQALDDNDGDINELIGDKLGDWPTESTQNLAYLNSLAEAVERLGTAAGIFAPDEDEAVAVQAPTA